MVTSPEEIRKILDKAGKHTHKIRTTGRTRRQVVLEQDCPRCRKIRELLGEGHADPGK